MRNNSFSLLSFVPFFFAALTVFVSAAETTATVTAAEPIEVLSANVRQAAVDDGDNHWLKRRDAMMDIIKSRKYDFIGTQELMIHPKDEVNQYKFMSEKLPEYGSVFRSREQSTELGEGTGVFYRKDRWQPDDTEQGVYWLSDTPEVPGSKTWKDQGCTRIVTGGLFYEKNKDGKLTGKSVYFYSTHFDHISEIARQKAANLVLQRIAERKYKNVPVIIVGDFNAGENTPAIRFLQGDTVKLDGEERKPPLGLVDTFRAVHPDATDVCTYQGFKQPKPNGAKIDFIFTTSDLKTTDAEIIRTKTPSGHYPSDHFFVRATLSLPVGAAESATVEELKTAIDKINAEPFTGAATEYILFAQKQGDALIAAADELLAQPALSAEDRKYAAEIKYWGIVCRYGADKKKFDKEFEAFADSLQSVPETVELYKSLKGSLCQREQAAVYELSGSEAIETFIRWRDKYLPFIAAHCQNNAPSQLVDSMIFQAGYCDPDGSAGLVLSTVEKLMPPLQEQKKSKDWMTASQAKEGESSVRRVQMPGKEMVFNGVGLDGNIVDVKDFRGKTVLILFSATDNGSLIPIVKKLNECLHNENFVFIDYNMRDSREVTRQKAETGGFSWTIVCRFAAYEKKLVDYLDIYRTFLASFLVGRDGKVIQTYSDGLHSSGIWDELKKLFPNKADRLTELAAEWEQIKREQKQQAKEFEKTYFGDETGNQTAVELISLLKEVGNIHRHMTPDKSQTKKSLELANLILAISDISSAQRTNVWRQRINFLRTLASQSVKEQPDTNPAELYAEMEQAVDEAFADETFNKTDNNNLILNKTEILLQMQNYLKRAPNKAALAREIQKRYVKLLAKETRHTNPHGGYNLSFFAMFYHEYLQEDEWEGASEACQSFLEAVIPIFEKAEDVELREEAKKYVQMLRRVTSVGKEFEFECVLMDGEKVNVKDLRGKVVLVNFWATWCGPCVREFPNMKEQYEKYKDKGYEMIALSIDTEVDKITKFQEKNNYPWKVGSLVLSKEKGLKNYHQYYGVRGVPTTFLLNRDGKVVFMQVGDDKDKLNAALEKVLRNE